MTSRTLGCRHGGAHRRLQALIVLLATWAGPAMAQAPSGEPPLLVTAATGQAIRQLASNLRGDSVLLLQDRVEGLRHQSVVSLVLRTPTTLLEVPDAMGQVDGTAVDCQGGTRSVWRSDVYRAGDTSAHPARTVRLGPDQQVTQAIADLALSNPLMASALRVLCAGGGTVINKPPSTPAVPSPVPSPAPLPASPGTPPRLPEAPGAPSPVPLESTPNPSAPQPGPITPVPGDVLPVGPGVGPSLLNSPVFAGSAFTLRTLARLALGTYTSPQSVQAEADVAAVLADVVALLESRPTPYQPLKVTLTRQSLDTSLRSLATLQRRLADKATLLDEVGLQAMALPTLTKRPPASFVAELYRHNASGQYVLAFRGTAQPADWISNLWVGVDLAEITSPHYEAADRLVAELRKKGVTPLVTGHSLGGGMAQYVAYRHALRVVGFNPSPVPIRYLTGYNYDVANARLFTALELPRPGAQESTTGDQRLGDPLSLGLDSLRKYSATADKWIKSNRQLVKPICLLTLPDPYFDAEEDEDMARAIGQKFMAGPLQTLLTTSKTAMVKKVAKDLAISQGLEALLDDPAWNQTPAGQSDAVVEAQKRAVVTGVQQAKAVQGMWKALGWVYSASTGKNIGKTAVQMGSGMVDMVAALYVKRMIQVHGMARFVRGLGATGDLSPYGLAPDGSTPCAAISSSY